MKREKLKLEKEIYNDIQLEIQKYYDTEGIEYKKKEGTPLHTLKTKSGALRSRALRSR